MGMESVLKVRNLSIQFDTDDGVVHALNGVDLEIEEGTTLGLVGETGAGKTTLSKAIMGLTQCPPGRITSGEIFYQGRDLLKLSKSEMQKIRGKQISMIFQDPMTALNPVMTVGEQIAEAIRVHEKLSRTDAVRRACEMMETVGLRAERAGDYPHQFSGGRKQRVVIAIALICRPHILIADEPTTALDVTIQAQVLELITELQKKMNTANLLITHDLGIVAQTCQKIAIIYAGEILEYGTVQEVLKNPGHPYTIGLINSIPKIHMKERRLHPIDGLMPDPTNLPEGCPFCPRCRYASETCRVQHPQMKGLDGQHYVKCFHAGEHFLKGAVTDE